MKWFLSLFLFTWIISNAATQANFSFTYNMAQHCKEHLCRLGYTYDTYYQVGSDDRRVYKSDGDTVFEMHIAILAGSNGHILLSSVPRPNATDPVYEIVVGGGGNKFTELRRNLRRNARASAKTVGILSAIEFRAFYIKMSIDGTFEFGKEGEIIPIFIYHDVNPLSIKYFSFAAWNGVEAKFLYDCPLPGDKNEATPNSQKVEPQLSNSDQLKRSLLLGRDPNRPPGPVVDLSIGLLITSISYDAFESKLKTGISITMEWMDNSLAWNPNKFNDTAYVWFRQGQIWTPSLFVFNSNDVNMLDAQRSDPILVDNSGDATLNLQTTIESWCFDAGETSAWPHDEYECVLLIEPWQVHERISFKILNLTSDWIELYDNLKVFTGNDTVRNAWDLEASEYIVNSSIWEAIYEENGHLVHLNDRLVIDMKLRRQAKSFNLVFYTPLIVLVTFVLISFWTEPLKIERVWFYSSCTVAICMGLSFIDYLIPSHIVPTILILYVTVLGGILTALLIHVSLMTNLAETVCATTTVQNILQFEVVRSLFCLPKLKKCQIYETIDEVNADDDASGFESIGNQDMEQMQTDSSEYSGRQELALVLDKAMFFVYSVTFATMLALHF